MLSFYIDLLNYILAFFCIFIASSLGKCQEHSLVWNHNLSSDGALKDIGLV